MDLVENTVPLLQCSYCVHVCWGVHLTATEPSPSNGRCLQSHYLATVIVYLLISRSLPSNGSACHSIFSLYIFIWQTKKTLGFLSIFCLKHLWLSRFVEQSRFRFLFVRFCVRISAWTPLFLTNSCRGFPPSFQENTGIVSRLDLRKFIPTLFFNRLTIIQRDVEYRYWQHRYITNHLKKSLYCNMYIQCLATVS
jgi:hypothetical protein